MDIIFLLRGKRKTESNLVVFWSESLICDLNFKNMADHQVIKNRMEKSEANWER